ncbi:hypothetical protein KEM54_002704 [Ascosphaera aggregata]|nr:hypothetical protein KEM54_002704 [Ascosphaera aggregata]
MDSDDDLPPDLIDVNELEKKKEETLKSQSETQHDRRKRVPITIITGYLGAGKTTLLNHIMTEKHGKRIAVIMNEFGDSVDVERSLTVKGEDGQEFQEWLELGNGCLCCTVQDSGVVAIESLMERQGAFDYILLETTGLADPGNIAPLFWADEGLGSSIYLDGIVTLVDAKNILKLLDEPAPKEIHEDDHIHDGKVLTTAHLQISHADVILLNKSDLVSAAELDDVKERLASINGLAKVIVTDYSRVPEFEGTLLEIHAYENMAAIDFQEKGHSHLDPTISTLSLTLPPLDPGQVSNVDLWLRSVLWEQKLPIPGEPDSFKSGFEIHRLKGLLAIQGGSYLVIQAVRELFDIIEAVEPPRDPTTQCKVVIIGRALQDIKDLMQNSLLSNVVGQ